MQTVPAERRTALRPSVAGLKFTGGSELNFSYRFPAGKSLSEDGSKPEIVSDKCPEESRKG